MPTSAPLKVVGWSSNYKSVQKLLDWMKKERLTDPQAGNVLDIIEVLCQAANANPDQIIARGKSRWSETTKQFTDFVKKQGFSEKFLNDSLAIVITFLAQNKAF